MSSAPAKDPTLLTVGEIAAVIQARKVSPVELTRLCLESLRASNGFSRQRFGTVSRNP